MPGDAGRVMWQLLPSCSWSTVFNSTCTQDSPSAAVQGTGSHVLSFSWADRDRRSLVQAHTRLPRCPSTMHISSSTLAQIPASLPVSGVPVSRLVQLGACCKHMPLTHLTGTPHSQVAMDDRMHPCLSDDPMSPAHWQVQLKVCQEMRDIPTLGKITAPCTQAVTCGHAPATGAESPTHLTHTSPSQ